MTQIAAAIAEVIRRIFAKRTEAEANVVGETITDQEKVDTLEAENLAWYMASREPREGEPEDMTPEQREAHKRLERALWLLGHHAQKES